MRFHSFLELDSTQQIFESSIITYEFYHCHGRYYDQWTNEYYVTEFHFAIESVDEYF